MLLVPTKAVLAISNVHSLLEERQKRGALSQWKSATARELVAGRKSGFQDVLLLLSLPSQSKTEVAFGSSSSSPSFIF